MWDNMDLFSQTTVRFNGHWYTGSVSKKSRTKSIFHLFVDVMLFPMTQCVINHRAFVLILHGSL